MSTRIIVELRVLSRSRMISCLHNDHMKEFRTCMKCFYPASLQSMHKVCIERTNNAAIDNSMCLLQWRRPCCGRSYWSLYFEIRVLDIAMNDGGEDRDTHHVTPLSSLVSYCRLLEIFASSGRTVALFIPLTVKFSSNACRVDMFLHVPCVLHITFRDHKHSSN